MQNGYVNLTGNRAASASGEALYYWNGAGTFDNAHQFARAQVVQADGELGLVLLGAADQALPVVWNSGTVYIYWYLGGVYQGNLVTAPSMLHAGDLIEAVLDADTVFAKVNGVVVASAQNATTLSPGAPGFETYETGGILDDWTAGTPGPLNPLPIQLASFGCTVHGGRHVVLTWTTVSEVDNYGFEIQRSDTSHRHFQTLTNSFIPGHGTTIAPQHYSWTDSAAASGAW